MIFTERAVMTTRADRVRSEHAMITVIFRITYQVSPYMWTFQ